MSTDNYFSVLTINYNSSEKLTVLLRSLKKVDQNVREIVIVDNNSSDLEKLSYENKKIVLIKNKKNTGFAKAVNQGINICKSEIILLLNPDSQLIDNSPLLTFKKIEKNKNIGAIGGKIYNCLTNKKQQTATLKPNFLIGLYEFTNLKRFFPNNKYSKLFWSPNESKYPIKVFSICGAYMFIRNQKKIRFNEKYFLYMEDVDFGHIIERNNLETWYDPESHICHIGGFSSKSKYNIVLRHWYKSRKLYFSSHLNQFLATILYIIFTIEEIFLNIIQKFKHTPNV